MSTTTSNSKLDFTSFSNAKTTANNSREVYNFVAMFNIKSELPTNLSNAFNKLPNTFKTDFSKLVFNKELKSIRKILRRTFVDLSVSFLNENDKTNVLQNLNVLNAFSNVCTLAKLDFLSFVKQATFLQDIQSKLISKIESSTKEVKPKSEAPKKAKLKKTTLLTETKKDSVINEITK